MNSSTANSVLPKALQPTLFPGNKRFSLLFIAGLMALQTQAQPIFTYGTRQVSKNEFVKAYLKNNDTSVSNKASDIKSYLDFYTRFKLKVQAAYDMKLDTLLNQQEEVMNFRQQIEEPFMHDQALMNELIREAAERGEKDLRVAHIFVPFRKEFASNPAVQLIPSPTDSAEAKKKIMEAYELLKKGNDFGKIAESYSGDPQVNTNKGDLGFITVFSLPYSLENIVYPLAVNGISDPYRSGAGWHIFKKTAERKAKGILKAQQILIGVDEFSGAAEKKKAASLADSLYKALKAGADFDVLALNFSYDAASAPNGGLMPDIRVGEYDAVFESQVFGLNNNGDMTTPFETTLGYHIVKRKGLIARGNDNTEYSWKYAVETDKRIDLVKRSFEQSCIQKTGMKKIIRDENELFRYTDSFIATKKKIFSSVVKDNGTLFEFPNQKIMVQQWLDYVAARNPERTKEVYKKLYDDFAGELSVDYYRKNLEQYSPEFKAQYAELMEGILLFEVMERKIWNKSASDTNALKSLYEKQKLKYQWGKSADAIMVNAPDSASAALAKAELTINRENWRNLRELGDGKVMVDSGRVEWTQIPGNADYLKIGYISPYAVNQEEQSVSFYYVVNLYPHSSQKNFDDAKGQLINDYQTELETKWISDLKKKYPVKINNSVVEQAIQELTD
jgi:peptidyl-prolyl cis-trans isomerase SurA